MEDARKGALAGAPDSKKSELLSSAVFEAWSAAELATDPEGAKQNPPVVRTPNGYYGKLINAPERRLVQIGEATHFVLLEKNRRQLYREVQTFLDE